MAAAAATNPATANATELEAAEALAAKSPAGVGAAAAVTTAEMAVKADDPGVLYAATAVVSFAGSVADHADACRADYDALMSLAAAEGWAADTPVDPSRLGELWPE